MPFIGRDWRANGELWTKTDVGSWERPRSTSISTSSIQSNASLSDIFNSLTIVDSVSDMRRFHYIAKVVQILFKEKLGELSGNAQRSLFQTLERMIHTVIETGDHIPLMQRMITQFHNSIQSAYPFYYYIGSAALWRQHIEMLERMQNILKQARMTHVKNNETNFESLPVEIQREIVRRLDNGKDLVHMSMINTNVYRMTQELLLWRQLCHYHFGDQTTSTNGISGEKILGFLRRQYKDTEPENIDWKKVYFKLKRHFALREVYAEMIHQCQSCKFLYWQDTEHSCLYQTKPTSPKPITPRKFVNMLI